MAEDLQKFLDELRARLSLTEIIGEKIKLQRRGRDAVGLCPFHKEKTPSFSVNESKGFYHCFGCGAHGDIISFVMNTENLPFIEAVKKLASRANMQLPTFSKESQEAVVKRQSLYEIMDITSEYFQKNLYMPIGAYALKYLREKRQFSDETIKKFKLGFAPGGDGLKAFLQARGVSENDMVDLGLVSVNEDRKNRVRDFFFDRLMIPITDRNGNTIAFGGRILKDGEPKYLNSPETPIFNKRRILYNMNLAKDASYAKKRLIICEGYMDVMALDSFDFSYAVAPLGTALTEEQVMEAWKVCPTPILCFDGDSAGIKAAIRSVDRILPILRAGCSVNYIFLKEKKDPDELLHSLGADVFEQYLSKAKPLVDILWHKCKMNRDFDTPEQKALFEKDVFAEVNKIKDNQIRAYYGQEMKKRITKLFGMINKPAKYDNANYVKKASKKYSKLDTEYHLVKKPPLDDLFIRKIIAAMIIYPQLISQYEEHLSIFEFGNNNMSKILAEILEIAHQDDYSDSDNLLGKLKLNYSQEVENLWELDMYKMQKNTLPELKKEIDDGLSEAQLKQLDKEIKECIALMKNNDDNAKENYLRYQKLIEERNSLIADAGK
ncbi:MAG: DNA primase [Alphaproteobacteria bacterium]|nr:DNA primase [Alphaproteobacteria bacterium]